MLKTRVKVLLLSICFLLVFSTFCFATNETNTTESTENSQTTENTEETTMPEILTYDRFLISTGDVVVNGLIDGNVIAIGKNGKIKFELCKKFCDKISDLNSYMCKNKYFIENVYGKSKFLKKVSNKMLHFCLNKKHYRILYLILKKRIYYSLFAIRYGGKDVIDFFNKENDV